MTSSTSLVRQSTEWVIRTGLLLTSSPADSFGGENAPACWAVTTVWNWEMKIGGAASLQCGKVGQSAVTNATRAARIMWNQEQIPSVGKAVKNILKNISLTSVLGICLS